MQRIIINNCIGGFGLSREAIYRYAELKGLSPFEQKDPMFPGDEELYFYHSDSKELFFDWEIKRDDWALVKVVEELGDKVNARHAQLKIVEIPDGVQWHIVEPEGCSEYIAENHRTWN